MCVWTYSSIISTHYPNHQHYKNNKTKNATKQTNRLSKLAAHNTHSGELLWELPLELGVVSSPLVGKSADGML